jgi:predicted permease
MAGLRAIVTALARAVWRDLRSFNSLAGNNFFLFIVLLLVYQPGSALFFVMILSILLLGPLSADPLRKVPPDRLALWPLSTNERIALRFVSPLLTPLMLIALPLFFKIAGIAIAGAVLGLTLAIQFALALWNHWRAGRPRRNAFWFVPRMPGRLGGLVQKDTRQTLSVLDPYVALVLMIGGVCYRFFSQNPDPEASVILAMLVVFALSTSAQCLFGLDLRSGMERYRVLPLRGREILLAKDLAFLMILAVLVLPLAPLPGLAAGLMVLGVGHHASILRPVPQTRWRFTGGAVFPTGLFQVVPMMAIGIAIARDSVWYFALALTFYAGSLWYCGRLWDKSF